jgi:alpha-1,6-mannosyltransferase
MELLYLIYRLVDTGPAQAVIKYMVIYGAVFVFLGISYILLKKQEFSRSFFVTVLVFSFIFGMTLLTSLPDQSDDIYRYIWDGKLQHYGISPYTYAPDDPALTQYHSEILPRLVNFPHIKTIYPPVAQVVFWLSYTLFGESVSGLKFLFLLTLLGSVCLFYLLLKNRKGDPRLLFLFAWNPLVIMETAINGHLDILMVFFVLLFLFYFFREQWILTGIALALAILTKLIPIILAPFIVLNLFPNPRQPIKSFWESRTLFSKRGGTPAVWVLAAGGSMIVTIVGFYWWYWESAGNMFLTALNYGTKWYFNNPVFMVILPIFNDNRVAHMVSFALFILLYVFILFRPMDIRAKFFYVLLLFIFMNPALHPWYLIVLLALLSIYRSHWVILWSGTIVAAYAVVYQFKITGIWKDLWILMAIEYVPLILFIILGHKLKGGQSLKDQTT